jgi:methionyl-tRNA formyltransferase
MKNIKVLYMGGNHLGVSILKQLLLWDIKVVAVVLRSSDTGKDAWAPSLKKYSIDNDIRYYQPNNPNSLKSIAFINTLDFDFIISAQYDRILSSELLKLPRLGSFNFHFSKLPRNRGCYPIPWAIIKGEDAGVSIHWINKGIDTGEIICSESISTELNNTAKDIYFSATHRAEVLFKKFGLKILNQTIKSYPQDESLATYHHKGEPNDRVINWSWKTKMIERFIRAFTFDPFPSAKTYYNDHELEIMYPVFSSRKIGGKNKSGEIIKVKENKTLLIRTGDVFIEVPHYKLKIKDDNNLNYIRSKNTITEKINLRMGKLFRC